ncbi:MAG TPA: protein kinase [Trebonia sp.]|nr:protein kinase [Trebonia sp.]
MELRGIVLGDRYLLESRIAAGGMGQVWLARDEVLGRLVAVKLLRPEYAEHPETLERFRAEARHAGVLSHPHIAQVYDYGHSGPFREPYLVMEYVDGPSLAEVIESAPLPVGYACEVLAQAADGLDAAHRAGLVHRDVKPGNMLLTSDGQVKITDFGIAHAAGSAPITAPGIVMGTSLYMAPERIAGGPGTPASDLYSLGIVTWECLVGCPPFRGTSADVMAAHLHQPLPPLPGWVPAAVCELVARLTAKDPRYRLADAGELAAQLEALELVSAGTRSTTALSSLVPAPGRQEAGRDLAASIPAGRIAAERGPRALERGTGDGPGPLPVSVPSQRRAPAGGSPWPRPGARGAASPRARGAAAGDPAAGTPAAPVAVRTRPARAGRPPGGLASRLLPGGPWPGGRRQAIVVAVIALVVGGLTAGGLAVSGAFTAGSVAEQGSGGTAAGPGGRSPGIVTVPASLDGQRVNVVMDWLQDNGLGWRLVAAVHTGLPTGTVIVISPSGPVQAGSTVTVTYANDSPTTLPPGVVSTGQPRGAAAGGHGASSPPAAGPGGPAGPGTASSHPAASATPGTGPGTSSGPGGGTSAPPSGTPSPSGSPGSTGAGGSTGPGGGSSATPSPTSTCTVFLGICWPKSS